MKGHYIVIDPNGKKYYYRTLGHAFNKWFKFYFNYKYSDCRFTELLNRTLINADEI